MIDQLNTASIQKLSAEFASGRLDSLLRIGQTQIAKVLEVSPQIARPIPSSNSQTQSSDNRTQTSNNQAQQSSNRTQQLNSQSPQPRNPGSQPAEARAPASTTTNTQSTAGQSSPNASNSRTSTNTNTITSGQATSRNQTAPQSQPSANSQTTTQTSGTTAAQGSKAIPTGANNPAYQAKLNAEKQLMQIQSPKIADNNSTVIRNNTTTNSNTSTATSQQRPSAQPTAVPTNADNRVYRTKISIEGKVVEIIMPRPIRAGTEVTISRDANNRLTVNVPQPTNTSSQTATPSQQTSTSQLANPTSQQVTGSSQQASNLSQQATSSTQQAQSATQSANSNRTTAQGSPSPTAERSSAPETLVRPGERALARVVQVTPEAITRQVELPSNNAQRSAALQPVTTYSAAQQAKQSSQAQATSTSQSATTTSNAPSQQAASTQYRITLDLQGRNVEVVAPKPIGVGTEVRVQQDSQGQVTLKIPAGNTQAVEKALREHMPLQQPPNQLLNLLTEPQNAAQLSKTQPLLQSLVQILLGRSIASPQQTDAQSIRQQLLNSGTQFENRIAKGDTSAFQQDQKGLLMKLQQNLSGADSKALPQPLGQRITQMTQQAISRVLFNQVSSLTQQSQDSGSEQVRHLAMDIPVLWQGKNENIQLRINSDEPRQDEEGEELERRWRVQLRFEMPEMPPMGADLALEGEKISILWFGNSETKELLEPHLDQLHQTLEGIGLEVNTLAIREQEPPKAEVRPPRQRLIDVKT